MCAEQVILVNLRKEIRPFIPKKDHERREEPDDDCSDILMVSESTAFAAHNEDANVALLGHTYVLVALLVLRVRSIVACTADPAFLPSPVQLRGEGDVAGRRILLHRLHLRRRAPHLRLRVQQQRSGTCTVRPHQISQTYATGLSRTHDPC